jgi:hypothetical protein
MVLTAAEHNASGLTLRLLRCYKLGLSVDVTIVSSEMSRKDSHKLD